MQTHEDLPVFSSESCIVLAFSSKSWTHFELTVVPCELRVHLHAWACVRSRCPCRVGWKTSFSVAQGGVLASISWPYFWTQFSPLVCVCPSSGATLSWLLLLWRDFEVGTVSRLDFILSGLVLIVLSPCSFLWKVESARRFLPGGQRGCCKRTVPSLSTWTALSSWQPGVLRQGMFLFP